jgi:hypothetical protein
MMKDLKEISRAAKHPPWRIISLAKYPTLEELEDRPLRIDEIVIINHA